MTDLTKRQDSQSPAQNAADPARRAALRRLGRFAAVTPPAVTLLLSAATKSAKAVVSPAPTSSRQLKEPVTVSKLQPHPDEAAINQSRRATLRRLGRFAAITPPAITLLLAGKPKRAVAVSIGPISSRKFKEHVSVPKLQQRAGDAMIDQRRRATLRRLGRFAAITPPAVTLLLSASTRRAQAIVSPAPESSRQFKEPVLVPQLCKAA